MKKKITYSFVAFVVVFSLNGCKPEDKKIKNTREFSGDFIREYFTLQCKMIKETGGFYPPQAARSFAYSGIALYQAVFHGIPGSVSLGGQLNGLPADVFPQLKEGKEYNWALAGNAATAEILRKMFEKNISDENYNEINEMEEANRAAFAYGLNLQVVERSVQLGKDVATVVYDYSKTDGGHESYLDAFQLPYSLPSGPQHWIPTSSVQNPVSPYWGDVRAFLNVNVTQTQPVPPVLFSTDVSSPFYQEAYDVYNQVKNLNTDEELDIARYWADEPFNSSTSVGHIFNILTQLLEETNSTLEKTAVAYAKMGIAQHDAYVSCWKTKYDYVLIRPVSYIKAYIDQNFSTVIATPPFPSYSSAHACGAGAGAKIFINLFTNGNGNYDLTDNSQMQYGFPARNFSNFNDMALECAMSQFYGGLHFPMDNFRGLEQGRKIGDNVNNNLVFPTDIQ